MVKKNSDLRSILILLIISFTLYLPTLNNGFVYDDSATIVSNEFIKNFGNFPIFFTKDYFELSDEATYRPIVTFTYFIDYAVFGLVPWGYHLSNVFIHSLNVILVFIFYSSFIKLPESRHKSDYLTSLTHSPFFPSLLFAVHPVLTEAVIGISFREDLLAFLFYMITLNIFLVMKSGKRAYFLYLISCVVYFLALLSKEMSATLPFVAGCCEILLRKRARNKVFAIISISGYFAVTLLYIWLSFYYFDRPIAAGHQEATLSNRLTTIPWLISNYLKIFILPLSLSVDHNTVFVSSIFSVLFIVPFILCLSLFVFAFLFKNRVILFGDLYFFITLLPVYNIIPIAHPFAERYLYLPLLGLVIITWEITSVITLSRQGYLSGILVIAIMGLYSTIVVERELVWSDDYSLWSDTVRKMPASSIAHSNLALSYSKEGKVIKAIKEFESAKRLKPDVADNYFELALIYQKQGRLGQARQELEIATQLMPFDARYHTNLGIIYAEMGKHEDAVQQFETVINLKKYDPQGYFNLALAYEKVGKYDKAIKQYTSAISLDSKYIDSMRNLGLLYERLGKLDEAINWYNTILSVDPNFVEAYYSLGVAYQKKAFKDRARKEFEYALNLDPTYLPARKALESLDTSKQ